MNRRDEDGSFRREGYFYSSLAITGGGGDVHAPMRRRAIVNHRTGSAAVGGDGWVGAGAVEFHGCFAWGEKKMDGQFARLVVDRVDALFARRDELAGVAEEGEAAAADRGDDVIADILVVQCSGQDRVRRERTHLIGEIIVDVRGARRRRVETEILDDRRRGRRRLSLLDGRYGVAGEDVESFDSV